MPAIVITDHRPMTPRDISLPEAKLRGPCPHETWRTHRAQFKNPRYTRTTVERRPTRRGPFDPILPASRVPSSQGVITSSYYADMANRLGSWIRESRTAQGLSQRDLGARTGVTSVYITLLETGQRRNPTVAVAAQLATALDVPVMNLIECVVKDETQDTSSERRAPPVPVSARAAPGERPPDRTWESRSAQMRYNGAVFLRSAAGSDA